MTDRADAKYSQLPYFDLKRKYNILLIQLYKPHTEAIKYLIKLLIENEATFNIMWDSVEPQLKIDLQWIDVDDLINISVVLDNINSPLYGVEF